VVERPGLRLGQIVKCDCAFQQKRKPEARMGKVSMTVRFPETARDAAVLMVDQMWSALHLGHLVTSKPEYEDAKWSWMRRAEEVLAKAEGGERGAALIDRDPAVILRRAEKCLDTLEGDADGQVDLLIRDLCAQLILTAGERDDAEAKFSKNAAVSANVETGWLIERALGGAPIYYGKDDEVDALGWTKDHARAIRYARREDAQMQIEDIGWTEARPVEHQWG
jgi:hypothetical protein